MAMERLLQFLGDRLARRGRSRDDVEDLIRAAFLKMPASRRSRGRIRHVESLLAGGSGDLAQAVARTFHLQGENHAQQSIREPAIP